MSSGSHDRVVEKLKDSLDQIRLSCARRAKEEKGLLFTHEIQNQLLDVTLPLAEDRDVWTNVWGASVGHFENDAILVYRGDLAIEDAKDLPLATCFREQTPRERKPVPTVQRLTRHVHQSLLGLLRLPRR